MTPKKIVKVMDSFEYFGLCPPSLKAQDALHILQEHFLGKDWHVATPVSQEQHNTKMVVEILRQNKPKLRNRIFNFLFKKR